MEPPPMMTSVAASLRARTGRSLEEWVDLVRRDGPDPLDQLAVRSWLRDVHSLPQNSQWAVADAAAAAAGWVRPDVSGYTDRVYAGSKAALRPLHEQVVALAMALGPDVRAEGRSTYIPLVRRRQFAAIAPGPRGALRVGLRFRGTVPADERLAEAKGFAQASHWLHLPPDATPDDVTSLEPLLRAAYEQDG
ncbi:MAG TPA: DUF5655 domain-containing protein [Dermatophilaceae bacterium]|nr:DUF5655 domain-containing protein [Dermatophilaceae bacterium]